MSVLEVKQLSKRFGSTTAVRDVSFRVERGAIFGLLGPNGSGKTTTLGCALGLLRPSGGSVEILGQPATRIARTRGHVGAVFDESGLLPGLSVRANLEYARRLLGHDGGRAVDEVLELVGASALAQRRAGRLSLGEKKRVAIGRALLGRPELVVLDEPLSALDALGVRALLALFRSLAASGLTLVLSSHRLTEMESVVTHAAIVAAGTTLAAGTLDEILGRGASELRVEIEPGAGAQAVLAKLDGVEVLPGARDGVIDLRLNGVEASNVNAELVRAGVRVSALVPRQSGLTARFEELVDAAHAEAPR